MTRMRIRRVCAIAAWIAAEHAGAAWVENPTGLRAAVVDPPGHESINRSIGNAPVTAFNLSPHRLVFQFEPAQGFTPTPAGGNFDGIRLTAGGGELKLALDIGWAGTQRSIGAGTNFQTSAGQFLWLGQATQPDPNVHILTFRPAVYAVGFVLARLQDRTHVHVRFHATAEGGAPLQDYSIAGASRDPGESPGEEVFVGFSSPQYGIQRVEISRASADGALDLPLYLDDLAVVLSPTGRQQRFQPPPAAPAPRP
jgi:hypothetical protein